MNTKEKIKVMQAWVHGKNVQCNYLHGWEDMDRDAGEPAWDWHHINYRIKPEPMEIEVWVRPNGEKVGIVEPADDSAIRKGTELGWTKKKFREVLDE